MQEDGGLWWWWGGWTLVSCKICHQHLEILDTTGYAERNDSNSSAVDTYQPRRIIINNKKHYCLLIVYRAATASRRHLAVTLHKTINNTQL